MFWSLILRVTLKKGQLNDVISEKSISEKEDDQQSNQMMQDIIKEIAELKKTMENIENMQCKVGTQKSNNMPSVQTPTKEKKSESEPELKTEQIESNSEKIESNSEKIECKSEQTEQSEPSIKLIHRQD